MFELAVRTPASVRGPNGLMRTQGTVNGKEYFLAVGNEHGAVSFNVHMVEGTEGRTLTHYSFDINGTCWMAWSIQIHSVKPLYDDEESSMPNCIFLDGMPCYTDGSSLSAHTLLQEIANGCDEEHVWNELEEWHRRNIRS